MHMATAVPLRPSPLQPEDWIRAAYSQLSSHGIETVRVEILARDLGATKGSFYWHFKDREDLLRRVLQHWEEEEIRWLEEAAGLHSGAAAGWAHFIARCADPGHARLEAALYAWSRQDERIASRVAAIETKRRWHIVSVFRHVGFAPLSAEKWSEVAWLVCLGWIDKATRDPEFRPDHRELEEFLSPLILAASVPVHR
jgi:AcrR family transcriptional regulator